jgi:addiction module RelE/StbE family toxin
LALVGYSEQALRDLERLFEFLAQDNASHGAAVVHAIADAVSVLARHPEIGRPVEHGLRELIISRGRTGYVALYRYNNVTDAALVLAIRHQKEAGYQAAPDEI